MMIFFQLALYIKQLCILIILINTTLNVLTCSTIYFFNYIYMFKDVYDTYEASCISSENENKFSRNLFHQKLHVFLLMEEGGLIERRALYR